MNKSTLHDQPVGLQAEKTIKNKLNKAFCEPGKVEDNGVLAFAKHVLMVINKEIEIKRPEKFGGNVKYKTYDKLEKDYIDKKLHPMDLKNAVVQWVVAVL